MARTVRKSKRPAELSAIVAQFSGSCCKIVLNKVNSFYRNGQFIVPDDVNTGNTNPYTIIEQIRQKLLQATREYSSGRLNAAQFNALYRHYTEKRLIIEKLLERNPETDAWRAAASEGHTVHLRDRFAARPLYFVVFQRDQRQPLMSGGKLPEVAAKKVHQLLQILWRMRQWRQGLARKSLGDGMWLMLMAGEESLTITVFFFQPSTMQIQHIRDLHRDFERANMQLLRRNAPAEEMVFPQRALLEQH
jgi:hypothetical protein